MNYAYNLMINSLYNEINSLINKTVVLFEKDHLNVLDITNSYLLYLEDLIDNYKYSNEVSLFFFDYNYLYSNCYCPPRLSLFNSQHQSNTQ